MCFDLDSLPPVPAIAGAAVSHDDLVLESADGNRFAAFAAAPDQPAAPGSSFSPTSAASTASTRSSRCASPSAASPRVAIDYFGRTAGARSGTSEFEYMEHVAQTTPKGSRPTSPPRVVLPPRPGRLRLHGRFLLTAGATRGSRPRRARARRRGRLLRDAVRAQRAAGPDRACRRARARSSRSRRATTRTSPPSTTPPSRPRSRRRRRARAGRLRGRAAQLLRSQAGAVRGRLADAWDRVLAFVGRYAQPLGLDGSEDQQRAVVLEPLNRVRVDRRAASACRSSRLPSGRPRSGAAALRAEASCRAAVESCLLQVAAFCR